MFYVESMEHLIEPRELDARLRYPRGRSLRLAKRGLIPCVRLPDGEIRFDPDCIDSWLKERASTRPIESGVSE